ncbi:hypothetical protein [Jatrophihabitans sp.]|uniref:hypothetical protein n=1 Tax=Jatrophihabitans sp. TaxID=1932789 RepID=UPI002CA5AC8B|nr:hypothetical protein [Jatrophihabitans sp.]
MTDQEKSHDTPILLNLAPSDQNRESVAVHIHTKHGRTVGRQLMDEFETQQVEVQFGGYAQDVTHTVITVVSAAGGLAGAAAALNSFFQRNSHRRITVKTPNREVSIEGFSLADTETLLKEALMD